jgi:hypothetical protein
MLSDTVSFTEGTGLGVLGTAVVLDASASVDDVDLDPLNAGNSNYNGTTLTLARHNGASAQDVFGAKSGGTLTLSGGNVQIGAVTIGTFNIPAARWRSLATTT